LADQGLIVYKAETEPGVLTDFARAVAISRAGLWAGFFTTAENPTSGLAYFDGSTWENCSAAADVAGENINAMLADPQDRVWVGTEKYGIRMWDGARWHTYMTQDGLPSGEIYSLTADPQGNIWAGTWAGLAEFSGGSWANPYSVENNTLFNDHVHAAAFASSGDILVGHIDAGVSQFVNSSGSWHHLTKPDLGGVEVRSMAIVTATAGESEAVWIATADGGATRMQDSRFKTFRATDGLPSDDVEALAVDKYGRVWAATDKGVAYFEAGRWVTYDTLNTFSVAFGPACQNCPYDDDSIWTGTAANGLEHTRVPFPDNYGVVQVVAVCVAGMGDNRTCQPAQLTRGSDVVTATVAEDFSPGELFRPQFTIVPLAPYQLREDWGDQLIYVASASQDRFGAWPHIAIKGTWDPGQPAVVTDYDDPLKAPQLAAGQRRATFVATWRTWLHTRSVGPVIRLVFAVSSP
jgi:hypothetical protein